MASPAKDPKKDEAPTTLVTHPATPTKQDTKRQKQTPPSKLSPSQLPPTSPPHTPSKQKYAAGLCPMCYVEDPATKELSWKVLLLVEYRRNEQKNHIHPLAGKQEVIDSSIPIKTALREFTEETYGLFGELNLEKTIEVLVQDHNIFSYMLASKMYFVYALVPYKANIQELYLEAKAKQGGSQGEELFWVDLDDFCKLKNKITRTFNDTTVTPSSTSAYWFKEPSFMEGYLKLKEHTLAALRAPTSEATSSAPVDAVADLTKALADATIPPQ